VGHPIYGDCSSVVIILIWGAT